MKKALKNNFVVCIAVCVLVLIGIAFAGDVIVQEGDVDAKIGYFNSLKVGENVGTHSAAVIVGGDSQNPIDITAQYAGICMPLCVTTDVNGLSVYGLQSAVVPMGTGNYSDVVGVYGRTQVMPSRQCTNAIGGKFYASAASSDVINCYALYIEVAAGGDNNWAVYDNTSAPSCLHSLSIGSTSAPSVKLDVTGSANISEDLDVDGAVTMDKLVLPVKTTAGHPDNPVEGQIYVNIADSNVCVFADGAWRELTDW